MWTKQMWSTLSSKISSWSSWLILLLCNLITREENFLSLFLCSTTSSRVKKMKAFCVTINPQLKRRKESHDAVHELYCKAWHLITRQLFSAFNKLRQFKWVKKVSFLQLNETRLMLLKCCSIKDFIYVEVNCITKWHSKGKNFFHGKCWNYSLPLKLLEFISLHKILYKLSYLRVSTRWHSKRLKI